LKMQIRGPGPPGWRGLESETVKRWSCVPRDSDPRKTALTRVGSSCKQQTRLLVREGAPRQQSPHMSDSNKNLVLAPDGADWPSVVT
jgi:hypothetical protein